MLSGTAALSRLEAAQASDFSPEILGRIQSGPGSEKSALLQTLQMSVRVKKKIVELDPLESGLRKTLNLGHTFGHALETAAAQQAASKRLSHGSAVALGLLCALRFAVEAGLAAPTYYERILALTEHLGLPTQFQGRLPAPNELRRLLKHDKKALGGKLDLILPTRPGAVEMIEGIRVGQVERVLRRELG
jgi:3-dehydroquinate synthase